MTLTTFLAAVGVGYVLVGAIIAAVLRPRADDRRSVLVGAVLWPLTLLALELGFLGGVFTWGGRREDRSHRR